MHVRLIALLATVGVSAAALQPTLAETSSEDAYKYREAIMTTLKGHAGATSMILRGLVEDKGQLAQHARALANGIAEIDHLFPAGSGTEDSEALPAVWDDPVKFAAAVERAQQASAALAAAAERGDLEATNAAFRETGGACRGCHDDFRHDDD